MSLPENCDAGMMSVELGNLVTLAYDQYMNQKGWSLPNDYQLVCQIYYDEIFQKQIPIGFVATKSNNAYLVFRGTSNVWESIMDIDVFPTDYTPAPNWGKVVKGFQDIYNSLYCNVSKHKLITCLKGLPQGSQLYITGHSLGAALSVLALPDISQNTPFMTPILYNFESPRAGNSTFASKYNNISQNRSFLILDPTDWVPNVPPGYSQLEVQAPFTWTTHNMVEDHLKYVSWLNSIELGGLINQADEQYNGQPGWTLQDGYAPVCQIYYNDAASKPIAVGFVATKYHKVYLVFRGALTQFELNLMDKTKNTGNMGPYQPLKGWGNVNTGFMDLYNSLYCDDSANKLISCLKGLAQNAQLFITGYDLGAALSVLALPEVCNHTSFKYPPVLFNLGCPRVGDQAFVNQYNSIYDRPLPMLGQNMVVFYNHRSFRIANTKDPVTTTFPPIRQAGPIRK